MYLLEIRFEGSEWVLGREFVFLLFLLLLINTFIALLLE